MVDSDHAITKKQRRLRIPEISHNQLVPGSSGSQNPQDSHSNVLGWATSVKYTSWDGVWGNTLGKEKQKVACRLSGGRDKETETMAGRFRKAASLETEVASEKLRVMEMAAPPFF